MFEQIFKEQVVSQVGVIGHRLPTPVLKHVRLFSCLRKTMFKNRETCHRSFQCMAWRLRAGVSAPAAGLRGALRAALRADRVRCHQPYAHLLIWCGTSIWGGLHENGLVIFFCTVVYLSIISSGKHVNNLICDGRLSPQGRGGRLGGAVPGLRRWQPASDPLSRGVWDKELPPRRNAARGAVEQAVR